jgi:hypothetical protein
MTQDHDDADLCHRRLPSPRRPTDFEVVLAVDKALVPALRPPRMSRRFVGSV